MREIESVPTVMPSLRARSDRADDSDDQLDPSLGGASSADRHERLAEFRSRISAAQISLGEIATPVRILFFESPRAEVTIA
jgi:hypothetical protein